MENFGAANVPLVKKSFNKFLAMGEKATSDDFRMVVAEYPDLEFLVQTTQMPPIKREMVEIIGPHGVQVQQQGKVINAHEVPITFIETISGEVLKTVREWVKEKKYLDFTLSLVSEAKTGSDTNSTVVFEKTWIESEGIELSVDDNTPIKPSATLHVNWVTYLDADGAIQGWGL
jgi:hypothetical protein